MSEQEIKREVRKIIVDSYRVGSGPHSFASLESRIYKIAAAINNKENQ